jgi:hypothetical protein
MHMPYSCIRGLQEKDAVGGSPAVAVGYDFELTIRFRICLRFPAGGDWLLTRRTSMPAFQNLLILPGTSMIETKRMRLGK